MSTHSISLIGEQTIPALRGVASNHAQYQTVRVGRVGGGLRLPAMRRVLIRPQPGHYIVKLMSRGPPLPALIYQRCPMVLPQPGAPDGPHPDDWCRPLDRSPVLRAQINGRHVPLDRVWTSRSLRLVSAAEYAFRMGPLRHWARSHARTPAAAPHRPVNLAILPPLF